MLGRLGAVSTSYDRKSWSDGPALTGEVRAQLTKCVQMAALWHEPVDCGMGVPGFLSDTLITTDEGERPISELVPGDRVLTADGGYQPIRWIALRKVAAQGDFAPVCFPCGFLRNNRDLWVSQQQNLVIKGPRAARLFDDGEVLAPARSLTNDRDVTIRQGGTVEYAHVLFDAHEVIFANGAPVDSLYPSARNLNNMHQDDRVQILSLFPDLGDPMARGHHPESARKFLSPKEMRPPQADSVSNA